MNKAPSGDTQVTASGTMYLEGRGLLSELIPHATRNMTVATFGDALQLAKEIIGRFADGSPTKEAQAAARAWADLDYMQESFRVK